MLVLNLIGDLDRLKMSINSAGIVTGDPLIQMIGHDIEMKRSRFLNLSQSPEQSPGVFAPGDSQKNPVARTKHLKISIGLDDLAQNAFFEFSQFHKRPSSVFYKI